VTLGNVIALTCVGAAVLFEFYRYEAIHLPMFNAVYAEVMYDKCVRDCRADQLAACAANGIPAEQCVVDCSRCRKYLEGE
jgi:hypothetical protein